MQHGFLFLDRSATVAVFSMNSVLSFSVELSEPGVIVRKWCELVLQPLGKAQNGSCGKTFYFCVLVVAACGCCKTRLEELLWKKG